MAADQNNAGSLAGAKISITPDISARTAPGFLADTGAGQVQAASGNATLGGGAAGAGSSLVVTGGANLPPGETSSGGLFSFPGMEEAGGVAVHDFSPLDVADISGSADPNAAQSASVGGGGMTITLPDDTRITFAGILPVQSGF